MSNLIIPDKIGTHKPKVTKTQMIEALMIAAKDKHDAEKDSNEKELEKLQKEIDALLLKSLKNTKIVIKSATISYSFKRGYDNHYRVEVVTTAPLHYESPEMTKLLKKYKEAYEKTEWDATKVRMKIVASLSTPNPLLQKTFKKALNDTVTQILNPEVTQTIEC